MAQNKENILTKGMSGTSARMLTFRQKAILDPATKAFYQLMQECFQCGDG
jgi:hypothetical protein